MRALLDISVLVALFDEGHVFNERAHAWLEQAKEGGIATCPLVENGLVRVLSNPNYGGGQGVGAGELIARLRQFTESCDHVFWPDDVSLRDAEIIDAELILGPRQITAIYLLAVAVKHGGRLVTFDEGIGIAAVRGAKQANLWVV